MQIGHIVRGGVILIAVAGFLDGSAAVAQSLPADGRALPAGGSLRLARIPVEPPSGRMEPSVQGDQQPQATFFDRGGLHLALGATSFWQRPTAQPEAATFLSAGCRAPDAAHGSSRSSLAARHSPERPANPTTAARTRAASTPSRPDWLWPPAEGWTFISQIDSRSVSRRPTGASASHRSKGRSGCS